jgi:hypothetical protein
MMQVDETLLNAAVLVGMAVVAILLVLRPVMPVWLCEWWAGLLNRVAPTVIFIAMCRGDKVGDRLSFCLFIEASSIEEAYDTLIKALIDSGYDIDGLEDGEIRVALLEGLSGASSVSSVNLVDDEGRPAPGQPEAFRNGHRILARAASSTSTFTRI